MGQSGKLLGAKVQRLTLIGLDGQVSGGGGRRGVFHLLGNKRWLSGESTKARAGTAKAGIDASQRYSRAVFYFTG